MGKIKVDGKEYTVRELKGQDLFVFFAIADKLEIDAKKINEAAGNIKYLEEDKFYATLPKDTPLAEKESKYADYLNSQASGAMGVGIMTFLIKKSHLVKKELNEVISAAWDMEVKVVKELNIKDYAAALKGALQVKAITEAFKSFFQSDNQK